MIAPSNQEFAGVSNPIPQPAAAKRIALFVRALDGGVGRRFFTLAEAFSKRGYRVDVLVLQTKGPYLKELPAAVHTVILNVSSVLRTLPVLLRLPGNTLKLFPFKLLFDPPAMIKALPALKYYMRKEKPDVLLAAIEDAGIVTLWARWLTGVNTRVVVQNVATFSKQIIKNATKLFECLLPLLIQHWYPRADSITTVSNGAADDLAYTAGIPRERITTIYNPVDLNHIVKLAALMPDDPWLLPNQPPVLLAVGRLDVEKDFPTLLRAFAQLRKERELRLIILGEGKQRVMLETLCNNLEIAKDVRMPGFVSNPYAYMARAAVLVLSSAWEGFPNVLLEAMACGCPVVSTNCPGGVYELLAGGIYGQLVPVGNFSTLAQAILETLDTPCDSEKLRQRARMFSLDTIVDQYLQILLGRDTTTTS